MKSKVGKAVPSNKQTEAGGPTATVTTREVLFKVRMEVVGVFTKQGQRTMLDTLVFTKYKPCFYLHGAYSLAGKTSVKWTI